MWTGTGSILLPALAAVLKEYGQGGNSRWMFPSPAKEDSPLDPATCRKRLQTILDHAGCKRVLSHDLRHVFVMTALESGMDIKTLSTILGHVSAATTLNIYTHVTDAMRQTAAAKIDRSVGKSEPQDELSSGNAGLPTQTPGTHLRAAFEPCKGKKRKAGTGCVTQINDHLWEGRYSPQWPDGKRHPRNLYAHTVSECEDKLAELIRQMKAEIEEARRSTMEGKREEAMAQTVQKKGTALSFAR